MVVTEIKQLEEEYIIYTLLNYIHSSSFFAETSREILKEL